MMFFDGNISAPPTIFVPCAETTAVAKTAAIIAIRFMLSISIDLAGRSIATATSSYAALSGSDWRRVDLVS